MRRTEPGRVAAEDAGDAAQAQRRDVLAHQRARLGAVVDEQRECGAARERLDPERAGAGEQVEHARAGDRIAIGVRRMLNSASRSRSAVGRTACDFGAASARPRRRPPTMRISASCRDTGLRRRPRLAPRARLRRALRTRRVGRRRARPRCFVAVGRARSALRAASRQPLLRSAGETSPPLRFARGSGVVGRCGRFALRHRRGEIRSRQRRPARPAARAARGSAPPRPRPREIAELERAERHADQPVTASPRWPSTLLHLAVLALADGEGEPHLLPCSRSSVASIGP